MIDKTDGKLAAIKKFATDNGLEENFNLRLNDLAEKEKERRVLYFHRDFAPLSLYFEVFKDEKLISNGGLIFHGAHNGGGNGSAPTFSVNLIPVNGWEIHT